MAYKMMIQRFVLLTLCMDAYVEAHSPKAIGMGDAGVAYPQDAISSYYNPANAAEVGDRWDVLVGTIYDPYSSKVSENPNPDANIKSFGRRTWAPLASLGVNKYLCNGLSVNFTFSNRFYQKTHYNKPSVLAGTTTLGHGYEKYAASGTVAYSWCHHNFGVSLDFLVGRHKEIGVQNFDNSIFSVAPGHVTNRGYDWNYGLGVTFGWLWDIMPELKVGVMFRPETKMTRFHKYKGVIPSRGILHSPQEITAGFSYRLLECATFVFDYNYVWGRRIRAVKNPVASNPFIVLLGSKHGSSYGLRNQSVFKFGLDYAITDFWIGRIGYIYERETNRSSQAFLDTIFNKPEEHFITLGSSFQYNCWDIDVYYVHGFERKVSGPVPAFEGGGKIYHKRSVTIFGLGVGKQF